VTGGPVESLDPPAVVVDLDVMDANIRRGIDRLAGAVGQPVRARNVTAIGSDSMNHRRHERKRDQGPFSPTTPRSA
jgi:hypothetical protein